MNKALSFLLSLTHMGNSFPNFPRVSCFWGTQEVVAMPTCTYLQDFTYSGLPLLSTADVLPKPGACIPLSRTMKTDQKRCVCGGVRFQVRSRIISCFLKSKCMVSLTVVCDTLVMRDKREV